MFIFDIRFNRTSIVFMINPDFLKLLIHPRSKAALIYNEKENSLSCQSEPEQFKVTGSMPVILLQQAEQPALDPLHQQYHSVFSYTDHYQKDAESFDYFEEYADGATRHENKRLHETILHHVPENPQWALDTGCGNGWVSKALIPGNCHVISMDISTVNPLKAFENLPSEIHHPLVADVFQLPLAEGFADVIIASEIMEHVPDPEQFVSILYKRLKPGGRLIITTPYNEKLEYNLCIHCNRLTPKHAHLHSFSEQNIGKLIPAGAAWHWKKFSNKYLSRLRTHIVLQYLPYAVWKAVDQLANYFLKNPTRLLIEITRK